MKKQASNDETLERQYQELELTCRVWIAVASAKDARIEELERENEALKQRVARLGRRIGDHRGPRRRPAQRQPLRRSPTMG